MTACNFKNSNNAKQCHQLYFDVFKNPSKCGVFGAGRQTMPRGYTPYGGIYPSAWPLRYADMAWHWFSARPQSTPTPQNCEIGRIEK